MSSIVVIGSYNVGLTVLGERIPQIGETVMGRHFEIGPGGKGSNQAIAARRLGGKTVFVARVGNDIFGRSAIALFRREQLPLKYIAIDDRNATGAGIIFVDDKGRNAIGVAPGANLAMTKRDLDRAAPLFKENGFLLIQLEIPLPIVFEAAKRAKKAGMTVILNPAPVQRLESKLLALCDYLTPNATEAAALSGVPIRDAKNAEKAAKRLQAKGAHTVIITLGDKGAFLASKNTARYFPPYKVPVVDTTGAGDAFNGGLVYALASGMTAEKAVDFASKVAAVSVTRVGVVPGLPTLRDIKKRLWRKA